MSAAWEAGPVVTLAESSGATALILGGSSANPGAALRTVGRHLPDRPRLLFAGTVPLRESNGAQPVHSQWGHLDRLDHDAPEFHLLPAGELAANLYRVRSGHRGPSTADGASLFLPHTPDGERIMRTHYNYVAPVPRTFTIVFGHAANGMPQQQTGEGWINASTRDVHDMLLGALAFWAQDEAPTSIRILLYEATSSSITAWGEWGGQLADETGIPVAQSMPGHQILIVGTAVVDGRMTFEYRIQGPGACIPRGGGWQQRLPDQRG